MVTTVPSLVRSSLTTEFIRVVVSMVEAGAKINPTSSSVHLAFVALGAEPVNDDWEAASWETVGGEHFARVLVGPGALVLGDGEYAIWVKVSEDPEIPVRPVGRLRIT